MSGDKLLPPERSFMHRTTLAIAIGIVGLFVAVVCVLTGRWVDAITALLCARVAMGCPLRPYTKEEHAHHAHFHHIHRRH